MSNLYKPRVVYARSWAVHFDAIEALAVGALVVMGGLLVWERVDASDIATGYDASVTVSTSLGRCLSG